MLQLGRGMQCNALGTWLLHPSVLQVRRNQRLLVLVAVGPHEGVMFPERRPQAGGHWRTRSLSKMASSAPWPCTRDAPLMLWRAWLAAGGSVDRPGLGLFGFSSESTTVTAILLLALAWQV